MTIDFFGIIMENFPNICSCLFAFNIILRLARNCHIKQIFENFSICLLTLRYRSVIIVNEQRNKDGAEYFSVFVLVLRGLFGFITLSSANNKRYKFFLLAYIIKQVDNLRIAETFNRSQRKIGFDKHAIAYQTRFLFLSHRPAHPTLRRYPFAVTDFAPLFSADCSPLFSH